MQLGYLFMNWEVKLMRVNNTSRILILLVMTIFLSACTPIECFPEAGQWYCEELQMQLSFGNDTECFVIKNGSKMICACGSDRGSNYLSVGCQEVGCQHCDLGEEIFGAEFVSLDNTTLVVKDIKDGKQYRFVLMR